MRATKQATMSDSWPPTANLIPTIRDRESFLGQFFGLISKADEYILVDSESGVPLKIY